MNPHGLERLEWRRLVETMTARADTPLGKEQVAETAPDPQPDWLELQQHLYRAAIRHAPLSDLSLAGAVDLAPLVDRAGKGGMLGADQLWAVMVTIDRGQALKAALAGAEDPALMAHFGHFEPPRGLAQHIAAAIAESGAVRDQASPALAGIRQNLRRLDAEIEQVLQSLLRSSQWAEYLQEPLITTRRGRRVVPVKRPFSHQLGGLVHDTSGSGQTVFVEPAAVVERQNRIAQLTAAEAEEVERILRQLSQEVAAAGPALVALNRSVADADVMLAKLRWGRDHRAELPKLGGDELCLVDARHPLLANPVPLSLAVGGRKLALVITGPNTGGKTVALKTTGLLVGLALAGWPIPAAGHSTVPLYDEVFADIGDEQSLEQSLSTFSGHVRQLVPMVAEARPGVLVLLDEIGAGTDPEEGAALALALVDHLIASGATAVVTTHYARVKLLAYRDARVENARMDFDRERLAPTYRLVMGQPGSSQALYIARRLGLDPAVVDLAESYLGQEGQRVDRAIGELERVERDLHETRDRLAASEAALAARERALKTAEAEFQARAAKDRERLRTEVRRRLALLEAEASAAIQAANAKTRAEREAALRELRAQMRGWGQFQLDGGGDADQSSAGPPDPSDVIRVGQWVRGNLLAEPGQVQAIERGLATVEAGGVRLVLPVGGLVPVARSGGSTRREERRASTFGGGPSVGLECDLRGMTVLEAVDAVEVYLDRAFLAGIPHARLIHGKGTGSLRRAVQEHLVGHPHVAGFRLGQAGEGGDGVTVVQFRQEQA